MHYAELLLPEFDQEMASTRKVLERIPQDKMTWKAHPKSNTIGWVGSHLVEMVEWCGGGLKTASFDVAPVGGEPVHTPVYDRCAELLRDFDRNVAATREALQAASDEDFVAPWSLLQAGKPIFTMSRYGTIRSMILNHIIHHRAHLCVYLRLNNIPVPGLYGPSADEG